MGETEGSGGLDLSALLESLGVTGQNKDPGGGEGGPDLSALLGRGGLRPPAGVAGGIAPERGGGVPGQGGGTGGGRGDGL